MSTPPLTPENRDKFQAAESPTVRLTILSHDFASSREYAEVFAFWERSDKQFERIQSWIPDLHRITDLGQRMSVKRSPYLNPPPTVPHKALSRALHAKREIFWNWLKITAVLTLIITVPDILLNKLVQFLKVRFYDLQSVWHESPLLGILTVHHRDRLDQLGEIPSGILNVLFKNAPLPGLGFLQYSPAVLISALTICILTPQPLYKVASCWALLMIPVAWFTGLGILPSLRLWIMAIAITCLFGALVAIIAGREYLRSFTSARKLYNSKYKALNRRLLRQAVKQEKSNARGAGWSTHEPYRTDLVDRHNEIDEERKKAYDQFEQRNAVLGNPDSFIRSEEKLNRKGYSSISRDLSPLNMPRAWEPSLAELIGNLPLTRPSPSDLANAAGISLEEATRVLEAGNTRQLPSHLHNLHEIFRHH